MFENRNWIFPYFPPLYHKSCSLGPLSPLL
ncbi:unnamed protein product [Tuber melanosporum]|uniref:(Perigord truffle) hypothetical protein n=1 Tax=Tuber melanosporum (strain Mel28) TaxID=656061 RepID=D5G759_TUBMM|nr:uncharacterized protein GSTUM_00002354001 [Tuber melanosporum]CAZ80352.1 unnamed protein product [Tuber melanosporum]